MQWQKKKLKVEVFLLLRKSTDLNSQLSNNYRVIAAQKYRRIRVSSNHVEITYYGICTLNRIAKMNWISLKSKELRREIIIHSLGLSTIGTHKF